MIADDRGPVSKFVASIGPLTTLFGLCPACKAVHFFIFNAQQFAVEPVDDSPRPPRR